MKLVVDANIIMGALIKSGATRQLILSDRLRLISPDFIIDETLKYREYICRKSGLDDQEFDLLMSLLFTQLEIIPLDDYEAKIPQASAIMKDDLKDIPYVACYLSCKCDGLWTNDVDFKDKPGIKVVTTSEILEYIR
jgi:predicted nucleic acid-binding protein